MMQKINHKVERDVKESFKVSPNNDKLNIKSVNYSETSV